MYRITLHCNDLLAGISPEAFKRHTEAVGEAIHVGKVSNNLIDVENVALGEPSRPAWNATTTPIISHSGRGTRDDLTSRGR